MSVDNPTKEHSSPISSPARTTKDAVTLRNQVNGVRFRRYNHWAAQVGLYCYRG